MKRLARTITGLVLAVFLATVLLPAGAIAGSKGRRNTAIGLTAGAIYAIARHKTGAALILGAGSAYAWKRYSDARRHERYRHGYRYGYGRGYYRGYGRGYSTVHSKRHYGYYRGRHVGWSHSRYYRGKYH